MAALTVHTALHPSTLFGQEFDSTPRDPAVGSTPDILRADLLTAVIKALPLNVEAMERTASRLDQRSLFHMRDGDAKKELRKQNDLKAFHLIYSLFTVSPQFRYFASALHIEPFSIDSFGKELALQAKQPRSDHSGGASSSFNPLSLLLPHHRQVLHFTGTVLFRCELAVQVVGNHHLSGAIKGMSLYNNDVARLIVRRYLQLAVVDRHFGIDGSAAAAVTDSEALPLKFCREGGRPICRMVLERLDDQSCKKDSVSSSAPAYRLRVVALDEYQSCLCARLTWLVMEALSLELVGFSLQNNNSTAAQVTSPPSVKHPNHPHINVSELVFTGLVDFNNLDALTFQNIIPTIERVKVENLPSLNFLPHGFLQGSPLVTVVDLRGFSNVRSIGNNFCNKCERLEKLVLWEHPSSDRKQSSSHKDPQEAAAEDDTLMPKHEVASNGEDIFSWASTRHTKKAVFTRRNLQDIGDRFLSSCTSLIEVSFGAPTPCHTSAVKTHEDENDAAVFDGLPSLERIGQWFMWQCTSLTKVDFGGGGFPALTEIPPHFLSECSALLEFKSTATGGVSLFPNVKRIRDGFLQGCSSLASLDLSGFHNVESIGDFVLNDCSSLKVLSLRGMTSLLAVGAYSFGNCSKLEYIIVGDCDTEDDDNDSLSMSTSDESSDSDVQTPPSIGAAYTFFKGVSAPSTSAAKKQTSAASHVVGTHKKLDGVYQKNEVRFGQDMGHRSTGGKIIIVRHGDSEFSRRFPEL